MNPFKNKKGIMHLIWWVLYVVITLFVYHTLKIYISNILIEKTSTQDLEYLLIQNKIIEELSYRNPHTNRIELGIIDFNKFKDDIFNEIEIPEEMKDFAIEVTLTKKGVQSTIYYNKGYYEKYYELREFSHKLIPREKKPTHVLVKDKNGLVRGELSISTIARRIRTGT